MATKAKLLHDYFLKGFNDNDLAVIYESGAGNVETLTYGELDEFASLIASYIETLRRTNPFIGVVCSPGLNLPAILLGILRAGYGYYCFDHRCDLIDSQTVIDTLGIDFVIADNQWLLERNNEAIIEIQRIFTKTTSVSVIRTEITHRTENSLSASDVFVWAYASRTSGTTGKRKIVLVPHASITPNIEDFIRIQNITSRDVIFGASPPTFDPFNVDLFTALGSHAKILFVPDSIKLNPKELSRMFLYHGTTIVNCTPALILRFGEVEAATLFGHRSPLRVLALGGERCLEKDHLRKIIPASRRSDLMLLNMYGTTEVSCWASVEKIDLELDSSICIGFPLSETEVRLFENDCRNQIYIGSRTRICTVLAESCGTPQSPIISNGSTYRETGDMGEISETGLIAFNGRLDRMIKRHGHFVNLTDIDNRVLLSNLLSLAATFYFFGKIFLIVKFKIENANFELENSKRKLGECLEKYLPIHYYPDKIIVVSEDVPLTTNGKLDIHYIKQVVMAELEGSSYLNSSNTLQINYPAEDVDEFILTTWKNNTGSRMEFESSDTFFQAGGNSARAVRFVEEIMQGLLKFGTRIHADEETIFLNTLNRCSFDVVRKYIFKTICEEKPHIVEVSPLDALTELAATKVFSRKNWVEPAFKRLPLTAVTTTEKKLDDVVLTLETPVTTREWTIDLLGCVDATPIILSSRSSHSGYIAAVNLEVLRATRVSDADSCILWRRKFPDRIATTACAHPTQLFAFIVCCDEILYAICVETGAVRWLHQINGLIRSTPACSSDGKTVYVLSSWSSQLIALNFEDGQQLWATTLSFVTAPLSISVIDSGIIVSTADVSLIKVTFDGEYVACKSEAERTCTPPIPLVLQDRTLVLVATLKGMVVAYDEDLVEEIWSYQHGPEDPVNPPLFHRCEIHPGLVIFTTHSGIFRILDAEKGVQRHQLKLRIESRSTPVCFTNLNVARVGKPDLTRICCAVVTDVVGGMHFINVETCKKIGVVQPSQTMECFSSAVISGDLVAFGGRSNKLHILQLKDVNRPLWN